MLVLSRKSGEEVLIGRDVQVKVVAIRGSRVRLGVSAPEEVEIRRAELPKSRPTENAAFTRQDTPANRSRAK